MGVDPGLARTGYGILRQEGQHIAAVEYGCLETPPGMPLAQRLLHLHEGIEALLRKHRPNYLALELLLFSKNARTAFQVGQARGVVLLAAAKAGLEVKEYNPVTVKQAVTSYGGASKEQVQRMVQMLLSLPTVPRPDDTADALAVALCCLQSLGMEGAALHWRTASLPTRD